MKSIKELQEFYESALLPELRELERARRKIVSGLSGVVAAVLFGLLPLALLCVASGRPDDRKGVAAFVLIAGTFITAGAYHALSGGYRRSFKEKIIRRIVLFVDPHLRYEPAGSIPESAFGAAKLFLKRPDRYRGEDYVCGTLGKTCVAFSEIHAEYKTTRYDGNGRRSTQWHTIFKGIFFIGDFNKHFSGATVVLPDITENVLGSVATLFQSWNLLRGQLIKLEDPEFERDFAVYGTDQIEARYILSPALMRRILDFKRKTNRRIFISFIDSKINVALSCRENLFEPRIFRTLIDFVPVRDYFVDLHLAVDIVDELNLNTRIWTKE